MEKITIEGFINAKQYSDGPYYMFNSVALNTDGFVTVMPYQFEVELPADFNMTASAITALEAQKEQIRKEFNARIRQISEQLSKLQCLEYVAADPL